MKLLKWLALGAVGVLFLTGVAYAALRSRPLGPSLKLAAQPAQAFQPSQAVEPTQSASEPPAAAPTSTTRPTATVQAENQASLSKSKGAMNLLILGLNLPESGPHGSDAIRLVRVDFDRKEARILPMPPDLRLAIPVTGLAGAEALSLTQTYWYGKKSAASPAPAADAEAAQIMAEALYGLFGYRADHYVVVNQEAFVDLIDEMGGLEVNLPERVDGTPENYGVYEAGRQLLDGQRTLNFARMIYPANDPNPTEADRMKRQDLLLRAMLQAGLKPANLARIPLLAAQLRKTIVTDMNIDQLLDLALLARDAGNKASLLEVGPDMYLVDEEGRSIPDILEIRRLIEELAGE